MTRKSHLIYNHTEAGHFLTDLQVYERAPAVFSDRPLETVSKRYQFLNSKNILDVFEGHGLFPVFAKQVQSRKPDGQPFKEHVVAFRKSVADGEAVPEVVYYNGHDGASAIRLYAGLYRFICSNEAVLGDGFHNRAYHSRGKVDGIDALIEDIIGRLDDIPALIERYRGVKVSRELANRIAAIAANIRWKKRGDEPAPAGFPAISLRETTEWAEFTESLTKPHRQADVGNDGWTLYNTLQESLTRSNGVYVPSWEKERPRKARPISSIKEGIRVNRELHALIERELFNEEIEVVDAEFV